MKITIETVIKSDIDTVWSAWNNPEDIKQWNAASDDWHTTSSTIDLREGGKFSSRMEAKDGSAGFDFSGTYTKVKEKRLIEYKMEDGRFVETQFVPTSDSIKIIETFDAETENDPELQRQGWQSILDNFAMYVEAKG
jgi:uncharacterized protein YndB with AHSA1/START domain